MADERITQAELDIMLKKHNLFMIGKNGGARIVYKFKNLSDLNFRGMNLSGADFTGSDLQRVNLSKTNCNGTVFYGCNLTHAKLDNASFERTDFRGADLTDVSMIGVDLSKADMRQGKVSQIATKNEAWAGVVDLNVVSEHDANRTSDLLLTAVAADDAARNSSLVLRGEDKHGRTSNLDLSFLAEQWEQMVKDHYLWISTGGVKGVQMDLSHRDLRAQKDIGQTSLTMIKGVDCKFDELYLVGAQLQGGNFSDSSVTKISGSEADFRGSNLAQVDFSEADLSRAHFESLMIKTVKGEHKMRTNLTNANFSGANLTKAKFRDAVLVNADFRGANLTDTDFRDADLTGAKFDT